MSDPAGLLQPSLLQGFALPLLERLRTLAAAGERPLIALNGPVGAGKSSLARCLLERAPLVELRLAVASIDDAYLPWQERCRAMAGNPFGVSRVPPGSHDTVLLIERLQEWKAGGPLVLPRFDKTLRDGQGDRCGEETLLAQAVVLEGWLLGCRSLGNALPQQLALLDGVSAPGPLTPEELRWLPHWDQALGLCTARRSGPGAGGWSVGAASELLAAAAALAAAGRSAAAPQGRWSARGCCRGRHGAGHPGFPAADALPRSIAHPRKRRRRH